LDVYTQAVTPAKHAAQAAVGALVFSSDTNEESLFGGQKTRRHIITIIEIEPLRAELKRARKKEAKRALFASSMV